MKMLRTASQAALALRDRFRQHWDPDDARIGPARPTAPSSQLDWLLLRIDYEHYRRHRRPYHPQRNRTPTGQDG